MGLLHHNERSPTPSLQKTAVGDSEMDGTMERRDELGCCLICEAEKAKRVAAEVLHIHDPMTLKSSVS